MMETYRVKSAEITDYDGRRMKLSQEDVRRMVAYDTPFGYTMPRKVLENRLLDAVTSKKMMELPCKAVIRTISGPSAL